ncbi:MAG: MBL fold metallo-hydrolase [Rhodospirillales bacterium]|nr:MBL fold metallo-hydrolase [Rhodospirillales bacterium]MBI2978065.1 MBL fold metallo-hydrolase [Rhodospirillales bacterium]
MTRRVKATILGCGPSGGVPTIHEGWGACDPKNPKNRRLRPSILIEEGETRVLVDTSPDLRQQLLNAGVRRLDAVLYTHAHADHLHGVDDLRSINRMMEAALPVYADAATEAIIKQRFEYVTTPLADGVELYYKPVLDLRRIAPGDRFAVGGMEIVAYDQDHGYSRTIGYRFGPLAYSTDLLDLPEASFKALSGVQTWIVGTFAMQPHVTHAHVDKALGWIERLRPARAVLTHLGPAIDHGALSRSLPKGVDAAFDGLVIEATG